MSDNPVFNKNYDEVLGNRPITESDKFDNGYLWKMSMKSLDKLIEDCKRGLEKDTEKISKMASDFKAYQELHDIDSEGNPFEVDYILLVSHFGESMRTLDFLLAVKKDRQLDGVVKKV